MRAFVAISAVLVLAACTTPAARVEYRTVNVPVAMSCVPPELPPAPQGLETKESLRAISDPGQRYVRLAADWAARVARMAQTEAVISTCRQAAH